MTIEERKAEITTLTKAMKEMIESRDAEGAKAKKEEIRQAKELLAMEIEIEAEERADLERQSKEKVGTEKVDKRKKGTKEEYRAISKYLLGKQLTTEERASINVGNSGAILPEQFINDLQVLKDGFPSLKKYCHVIPVSSNTGKMPVSSGSTTKKLAKLATDTEMVKEMITTTPVNYAVEDYGKIYPVENSVLEDTAIDFFNGLIAPDVAECSVNSENEEIIAIVEANATAGDTGTTHKALAKTLNTKVKPALLGGTVILTTQSGYDKLDGLEDTTGRPLLKDSLAVEGAKTYKGRPVVVMDDADLAEVTVGKIPFYVVNLQALCKFFDRKQVETATSTEAGFTLNQTFVRVLERFDVVKGDARCNFLVELTA